MRLGRFAPVALSAALVFSCQSVAPLDPGRPIAIDDARALARLDAYRGQLAQRSSLRAAARVSLEAPGAVLSRPQRLAVKRPASLRIEVLGLFDQVAGMVATDGVEFSFVDLVSGVRDRGPVDDGLLWRTARVDLTPADAVALLLGMPRLDPAAEIVEARQFEDGGIGVRTQGAVDAGDARARWHEWDASGRLRRAALREPDGTTVWSAHFSDWRTIGAQSFAHRVELAFPRVDGEASIRFQAVELEPALADALFVLHVSPGG